MSNALDRLRNNERALEAERRAMREALAWLESSEKRIGAARSPARLMIGLDLTGSRLARLEEARIAMAGMLDVMKRVGRFAVKAVYYRGTCECCETYRWFEDIDALCRMMLELHCESGPTQIERILERALNERETLSALVFIGDHCEEDAAHLKRLAAKLGEKSVPLFVFHECADHDAPSLRAKPHFRAMAEASGGVYAEFRPDSGDALKEMLASIAAFSAQGFAGIERLAAPETAPARRLREGLRLLPGSGKTTGGR